MIFLTSPGKTYSVNSVSGCTVSVGGTTLVTIPAGIQTTFIAPDDAVLLSDNNAIIVEVTGVGIEADVGAGTGTGGSIAYPGWVGYIEYDDETGEAIAADYSGLEMGGTIPESLKFNTIKFRGDWNGSIGKFVNCTSMFSKCTNLTSFTGDLSSLTNGSDMFFQCSNLTSFNSDLSSLTNGSDMFDGCNLDAASVERILNTIPEYTDGSLHSHTLTMEVQSGAAATKFKEITGTAPSIAGINVKFKGWMIEAIRN